MHNEASNLNSTLILTENELLVEDDDVLGDEEGRDNEAEKNDTIEITNRMTNGNHLELPNDDDDDEQVVADSLDLNLIHKIAPVPTVSPRDVDLDKIKAAKEKTTITSLIESTDLASNENVKSSDFSSDSEFY